MEYIMSGRMKEKISARPAGVAYLSPSLPTRRGIEAACLDIAH